MKVISGQAVEVPRGAIEGRPNDRFLAHGPP